MNNTVTIISILGLGALFSTPMVIDGVQNIADPMPPYMSVLPLEVDVDNRTVTQSHRVAGVTNMPAGWKARITSLDGKVYCEGGSKPLGASYHNGETSTFSWSIWTGGNCPEDMPLPLQFDASWTYDVDGQSVTVSASKVVHPNP